MASLGRRAYVPRDFPEAQTFRPTLEEFEDFPAFVRKMEAAGAHHTGIAKVVCPDGWVPREVGYDVDSFDFRLERPVETKMVPVGQERGVYQAKGSIFRAEGMSVREYRDMAKSAKYAAPRHADYDDLERKYWKNIRFVPPVYGADVTQTITDSGAKGFNSAKLDSILRHIQEDTNKVFFGVNSPYLYFGMWKATFPWHVEDMDFYAINFLHYGAPKTWYCVPPKYGYLLERAAKELFPNVAPLCTSFLRHKIALMSPEVLERHGVPVVKMVHEARSIIVVFPYAYHSGFNHGFNIAESTNFATERWIEYGKRHRPCDCMTKTVKVDMTSFVKRYQPDKLEEWLAGKDIAPHPEDPEELKEEIAERAADPVKFAQKMSSKYRDRKKDILVYTTKKGTKYPCDPIRKTLVWEPEEWDIDEKERYSSWKKDLEDVVCVDIYRHIELSHVEVKVDPEKRELLDFDGLAFLRARLGRPHIPNFQWLLDCGEMFLVDTKMIPKADIRARGARKEAVDPVKEAIKTEVADDEDDETGDEVKTKKPAPKSGGVGISSLPRKRPSAAISSPAETEDSEDDSYYSSSDQGDDSSDEGSTSSKSSGDDSEFDDPDFGKAKRKRRKHKKEKGHKRRRGERGLRRRIMPLTDSMAIGMEALLVIMDKVRQSSGIPVQSQSGTDNKENVPHTKDTSGDRHDDVPVRLEDASISKSEERAVDAMSEKSVKYNSKVWFDIEGLSKAGKFPHGLAPKTRPIFLPILRGLGITQQQVGQMLKIFFTTVCVVMFPFQCFQEGESLPEWLGKDSTRLTQAMEDILGHTDSVEEPEGEKWWPLARAVLTIFIETDGVSM